MLLKRKVMATFRIHEDVENVDQNRNGNGRKAPEAGKKRAMHARSAFQTVNQIKQDNKRFKIADRVSNEFVRVIEISNTQEELGRIEEDAKENVQGNSDILNLECVKLSDKKGEEVATKYGDKEKELFPLELFYNNEYRSDIWSYLKHSESIFEWPKALYMKKQKHLDPEMRTILVDWLVAVSDEYNLNEETLHTAVNYVDRFLSKMLVVRDKFQLLGAVAMMVAGKVEEIYPPDLKEWIYLSSNLYTTKQITKMEQLLLKVLKFDLQPPTIVAFIRLLCSEHDMDEKIMHLAMYLSELILLEGEEYLEHLPSKLAASSVALARFTLSKKPWSKKLESTIGYSLKQLSPVVQKQNRSFKDSPSKAQQSVQSKYCASRYHKVGLLRPKSLDVEFFAEE